MSFHESIDVAGRATESLGVGMMVLGVLYATAWFGFRVISGRARAETAYRDARRTIGRSVLIGLEVLVAADIIRTVVIDPTFTSVGVLAVIVLIRTFLSFALEVELTGRWPWQPGEGPAT